MAMTLASQNRSSHTLRRAPFCPEIRDFILESKRCQTLFANSEAACEIQKESCENVSSLKTFIYYAIFSAESDFSPKSYLIPEMDPHKLQLAENVQKKMISISTKYGLKEEIYFSVVWVFYFEYESKILRAIPVFKIYKKKFGREAEFLDLNLRSHTSWEQYLHVTDFGESFLCVPRNGEYTFFEETLDLEYFRPVKKGTVHRFHDFKPFSQFAVRPFLNKLIQLEKQTKEHIKSFLSTYEGSALKASLCVAWLIISKCTDIKKLLIFGCMVLGLNEEKILKSLPFSDQRELGLCASQISAVENELNGLIKLFQDPKKNWDVILLKFCSLLSKNVSVLMELFNIIRLPKILNELYLVIRKISLAKNKEVSRKNKNLSDVHSKKSKSLSFNSYGKTGPRGLENGTVNKNNNKEIFFNNFSRLEEISANRIQVELNSPDADTKNISSPCRIETTDDVTLFVFLNETTYDLFKHLTKLTGESNISLKLESDFISKIIDNSGNIIGSLYFINKSVSVGLFFSNIIDKNKNQNIE